MSNDTLLTSSSTWEEFCEFLFQEGRIDRTKYPDHLSPETKIDRDVFNRFSTKTAEELFEEIRKGVHLGVDKKTGLATRFSMVAKGILTDGEGTAWFQEKRIYRGGSDVGLKNFSIRERREDPSEQAWPCILRGASQELAEISKKHISVFSYLEIKAVPGATNLEDVHDSGVYLGIKSFDLADWFLIVLRPFPKLELIILQDREGIVGKRAQATEIHLRACSFNEAEFKNDLRHLQASDQFPGE